MNEGQLVMLIPLVAITLPIVLVPTIIVLKARHRKREWEHLERMKALDLGLPVPPPSGSGGVIAIGTVVPAVAILGAILVTLACPPDDPHELPISAVAWSCATLISLFAMGIALILGVVRSRLQHKLAISNHLAGFNAKPTLGPESYEFVGHRN